MTTTRPDTPPPESPGPATAVAGSTPVSERALAPDLARGMMLLLIALAHVPWFIYDAPAGLGMLHPAEGNLADKAAQVLSLVVVDARTHTMFGFLFAYGIGQMYARQKSRGAEEKDVRRILRTRHLWMLVFGAVHALLLWQGDIIGTYGLIGLVMMPLFFRRSDRTLKIWIAVLLAVGALFTALSVVAALMVPGGPPAVNAADMQRLSIAETGYLLSAAIRFPTWVFALGSGLASLALPTVFLIGVLAARHRFLEDPVRHLPLLRRVAVLGISVGWIPGLVLGLQHVGVLDPVYAPAVASVHFYTGIFTGVGYAALFGLIAHRLSARRTRPSLPVEALVALGRRSLSGYLAQSLVFAPFLAAWGLGLGVHLSSWTAVLVALGTWLLTVVVALVLDRSGRRGPAEILLRKLTYRKPARPRRNAPEPAA
ncbi:DUF418 domain-containing protein [Nocardiopsis sp. NPDC101807]|uniref:DUF418 domain-containing protein n=1 Tax=Nocardiopsis sp. NPDC101807 TaxID=3364339 RepID=UPI00381D18E0